MSTYRTAEEEVKYLEEQQAKLKKRLMAARVDARTQARKDRNNRLITAGARIEEIVHEGGFPDWEFSYPALNSQRKKQKERVDTATLFGQWALDQLKQGKSLETPIETKDPVDAEWEKNILETFGGEN